MRLRSIPIVALFGILVVAGCRPSPVAKSEDFGRFEGEVVAVWDEDGRRMTLREDFAYVDRNDRRWVAPAGTSVDGASIPRAFWTIVGGPFEGRYRNASVIHDVGCVEMQQTWEDVHRTFYEACRCNGVDDSHAKMLYYAVYHFGPRWEPVTQKRVEWQPTESGDMVPVEVVVNRVVRNDPPPPTPDEIAQVAEFIAEDNPNQADIEQVDRATLRRRPRHGRPERSDGESNESRPPRDEHHHWDGERVARADRTTWAPGSSSRRFDREGWTGERARSAVESTARTNEELDRRPSEARLVISSTEIPPDEQARAAEIVRQHLEQQADQSLPAEYAVERTDDGFRVQVQYLQIDEQGQASTYPGGSSTATVSPAGEILEVVSGN